MRARIHRGAAEVGGGCVELDEDGKRLLLDLGLPLTADADATPPLPDVAGLRDGDDPSLLGIVLSHTHPDHFGLISLAAPRPRRGDSPPRLLRIAGTQRHRNRRYVRF